MNQQTLVSLKETIEQRRAARAFRSDPIPEAVLQEILTLGLRAPSGFNLQPWRFIVVREQENKDKLKACAFNQRQIGEAPVVLICCGDRRVSQPEYIESVISLGKEFGAVNDAYADVMREQIPQIFQYQPCFDSVEAWTNRHTMLAVAYITLVAKSLGVDSCTMEGFSSAQVKEAFNIPEEIDVCCLLPLGYADEPFKKFGGRFPIEQVCHGESYGNEFQLEVNQEESQPTVYKNAVLDDRDLQQGLNGINPKFGDFVTRVAGEAWGLPSIDQKTKALITIAVDVVNQAQVGPGSPFGAHVDMAMKQGATRNEIEELLLFMCVYAGFNKVAGCFGALNEILGVRA